MAQVPHLLRRALISLEAEDVGEVEETVVTEEVEVVVVVEVVEMIVADVVEEEASRSLMWFHPKSHRHSLAPSRSLLLIKLA